MNNESYPHRQRRLDQIITSSPSYFLTLCTQDRRRVLNNDIIFQQTQNFVSESFERYAVYVNSYVLMPDHAHLIITIDRNSQTTLGYWVKAFKAMVALHEFKWQTGFFDHLLRSHESQSEKWEYIRMNPIRAGLVEHPEQWPYAQQFNPFNGSTL